jgi:hypothetical protein
LVSAAVRARPVAQRAAFEAQIPTEVLRQDQSRSAVHHEADRQRTAYLQLYARASWGLT